jgi:hypothetical protein
MFPFSYTFTLFDTVIDFPLPKTGHYGVVWVIIELKMKGKKAENFD